MSSGVPAVMLGGNALKTKYWIVAVFTAAVLMAGLAWALDTGLVGGNAPTAGAASSPTVTSSATVAETPPSQGKQNRNADENATEPRNRRDGSTNAAVSESRRGESTGSPATRQPPSPSGSKAAATATRPSWDPKPPASEAAGLEMPTQAPRSRTSLPQSIDRKQVLTSVPPTGASKGKLTSGFPKKAVPHPSGSAVTASSVSSQGKRVLVSLEGRAKASPSDIIAFYADDFAAKGWASTPSVPQAGEPALEGAYKGDSLIVTTRKLPTGQTAFLVAGAFNVGD